MKDQRENLTQEINKIVNKSKESSSSVKYKIINDTSFSAKEIEAILQGSQITNIIGDALDKIQICLKLPNNNKAIFTIELGRSKGEAAWLVPKISFLPDVERSVRLDDMTQEV